MIWTKAMAAAALSIAIGAPAAAQTQLPDFDIEAYCAKSAQDLAQGYWYQKACRDQEKASLVALQGREIEPKIRRICADMAATVGQESYWVYRACVEQEERARDAMK